MCPPQVDTIILTKCQCGRGAPAWPRDASVAASVAASVDAGPAEASAAAAVAGPEWCPHWGLGCSQGGPGCSTHRRRRGSFRRSAHLDGAVRGPTGADRPVPQTCGSFRGGGGGWA